MFPTDFAFTQTSSPSFDKPAHSWSIDSEDLSIPIGFEARYAYPLLVFLNQLDDESNCEDDFQEQMTQISERNFVGLRLQVKPHQSAASIHAQITESVQAIGRFANIHTQRIYLLGQRDTAGQALRVCLERPDSFAGFVQIAPDSITQLPSLHNFRQLRHLRALFLNPAGESTARLKRQIAILHASGIDVRTQIVASAEDREVGRWIDRFVMQGIYSETL